MCGEVLISFVDTLTEYEQKVELSLGVEEDTYSLSFLLPTSETIEDVLKSSLYYEEMKQQFSLSMDINDEEYQRIYRYACSHSLQEIFENCSSVLLHGTMEEVRTYLLANPMLCKKKIIFGNAVGLSLEELQSVKKNFLSFPNVHVMIPGNIESVSIADYERTIVAIEEIVKKIQKYSYTSFEAIMYAYDLVRDRFYIPEEVGDKETVSRDLSSVLLGDKIVCAGFANIFQTVLEKLGISSMIFLLRLPDAPGHARNLVYLQDEKYGIDGLYFFDPTFDCKKDEDNQFLFSYRFFAKTKKQIDTLSGYPFLYETYDRFSESSVYALEEQISGEILSVEELIRIIQYPKVNRLLSLIGRDKIYLEQMPLFKDDVLDKMYTITDLSNEPIKGETFLKALYQVRRNQYYENPEKYVFDMHSLVTILSNSQFLSTSESQDERLLRALFGIESPKTVSSLEAEELVETFFREEHMDLDIERVKLARLLKTHLEQKTEEVLLKKKNGGVYGK